LEGIRLEVGAAWLPKGNHRLKYETIRVSPKNSTCLTKGGNLEKRLSTTAFWIAIASTAVALITRSLALVGILAVEPGIRGGKYFPLTYRTFLEGAVLFFVMAIASAAIALLKEKRA
jgi:hypothetical protein